MIKPRGLRAWVPKKIIIPSDSVLIKPAYLQESERSNAKSIVCAMEHNLYIEIVNCCMQSSWRCGLTCSSRADCEDNDVALEEETPWDRSSSYNNGEDKVCAITSPNDDKLANSASTSTVFELKDLQYDYYYFCRFHPEKLCTSC